MKPLPLDWWHYPIYDCLVTFKEKWHRTTSISHTSVSRVVGTSLKLNYCNMFIMPSWNRTNRMSYLKCIIHAHIYWYWLLIKLPMAKLSSKMSHPYNTMGDTIKSHDVDILDILCSSFPYCFSFSADFSICSSHTLQLVFCGF